MLELCRAEWIKIVGHRRVLLYLLGIFPFGAAVTFFFAGLVATAEPSFQDTVSTYLSSWTDLLLKAWLLPNEAVGRVFLMALTAFTFAGEYQWGTWKNITPRRDRPHLVLVKFFVLGLLVLLCFMLTSVIMAVGGAVTATLAGVSSGPALTFEQIGLILPDYLLAAALAFLAFLITAIFAAFASVYSRSILGGCVAGILLMMAEGLLFLVPRWLSSLLETPGLLHLQRAVPLYNLENIRSWIETGVASKTLDAGFTASGLSVPDDAALFSVAVVAGWVVLGISAVVAIFKRQDITT